MMKLTKRMKNAIIQSSITNVVFFLILCAAVLFYSLPRIIEIWEKKVELKETYDKYNQVSQKWLTYNELKKVISELGLTQKDPYIKTLLRNTNTAFYSSVFQNDSGANFSVFLDEKNKELLDIKASDEYVKKDQTLSSVLPLYSQDSSFDETALSDFHFTNYVENLIYSFNLSAQGDIGIGEIKKITENEASANVQANQSDSQNPSMQKIENELQEAIFEIPLSFELRGRKSDMVDFIHFFERVGAINVDGEELQIYSDTFMPGRVLEGQSYSSEYNIYKNQVAEILNIEIIKYPDSSRIVSSKDLISLLKNEQWSEEMLIRIELNFYVAWVPLYRMEAFVNEFLEEYTLLSAKISADAKNYTANAYKYTKWAELQAITQLQNLDALVVSQQNNILNFRKKLLQKLNIDMQELYSQAIEYRDIMTWMKESHEKQIEILTK